MTLAQRRPCTLLGDRDNHTGHWIGHWIEIAGVTKAYGEHAVLRGIDLTVPAGTVSALLGPDGAGKTTMVRILSTLVSADAGRPGSPAPTSGPIAPALLDAFAADAHPMLERLQELMAERGWAGQGGRASSGRRTGDARRQGRRGRVASPGNPKSVRTPGLKATWSGGRSARPGSPTDAISPSSSASTSASCTGQGSWRLGT